MVVKVFCFYANSLIRAVDVLVDAKKFNVFV